MATEVSVRATGPMLTPRTLDEAMKFSELLAKSDLVPKEYKGKPGNVLVAIQWGFEIGLQPLQALQNLAVINGRPSIWGDAALALVRGSGLCESLSEHIDGEGEGMVAICTAKRRGQEDPIVARFSVTDARKAALWGRAGPWSQYSARMLTMRARGFCLRDGFADVLRGVITVEEAQDYPTAARDITPTAVADLDAFAGSSDVDAESVALTADATLIDRAHMAADSGSVGFREFYFGLDDDQRLELRPDISSLKQRAVKADEIPAAPESIDDLDAFGLKPIAEAASPAVEPDRDHPAIDPAPTDPSSPRARSAGFWSQDELHVSNSGVPGVIEFEIKRFLAECRDQLDVNGIEQANGPLIAKLPRATREDVEAAIAARRAELPTVAK